jgi:hypothetical protein
LDHGHHDVGRFVVVGLSFHEQSGSAHEGVEFGIGDVAIIKSLVEAFGRKEDQVQSQTVSIFSEIRD